MEAEVEILGIDDTWSKYGLQVVSLGLNGQDTGRRWILKNGEFVADVSKWYELLPNEVVVEVADDVAAELGAKPFHEFGGDWFYRMHEHVIQCGHKIHALYAWDEPVDLGDGDTIQLGYAVHNSIDGSMGFSVGLFTFRHACANMVWMGFRGKGMDFDDRNVLASYYRVHIKGLEIDREELKARIKTVINKGLEVAETYKRWREEVIDKRIAERLYKVLPKSVLPEWLQVEEPKAIEVPQATTVWTVYNDITQAIWHNAKTSDMTKIQHFKKLHSVLVPAQGVR